MSKFGLPEFARLEIPLGGRERTTEIAKELRQLADELEVIAGQGHNDDSTSVLTYHAIKDKSKRQ